ncbi:hypothetical protein [Lacrimispora indolis]|uniref:hypothetical protein n=1 Tax=Lacrimispora indolis TaxID=69825 RepID=UPI00045E7776|nr:hypothetical protein [Lacrimispora indolis]
MQEEKRTGLMEEAQNHTPMQETAATVEPDKTLPFIVMEALQTGKENAISAQELCTYLKFDNVRELQKEIARERTAGAVILSTCHDGGGYFLPSSDQEVKQFIRTLESRARNTFAALRSARNYIRQQGEIK